MDYFNMQELSQRLQELEKNSISKTEHAYLQKVIAAQILLHNHLKKAFDPPLIKIVVTYYNWLYQEMQHGAMSPLELTNAYLFSSALKKSLPQVPNSHPNTHEPRKRSHFDELATLARIWKKPLARTKASILPFLAFLMEKLYHVPSPRIDDFFSLLQSNWKPALAPLSSVMSRTMKLSEIEHYFFGETDKKSYTVHMVPDIARFFSITNTIGPQHLFVSQKTDYDLFDAALIVHELQHFQDTQTRATQQNESATVENLFQSERRALNAERVFLNWTGTAKKGKFVWLESNLFLPMVLLLCELDRFLEDDISFEKLSQNYAAHGLKEIEASPLFTWGAPFQMSVYCCAAMDLEPEWKKYLKEF